jgi:outer membrane protein
MTMEMSTMNKVRSRTVCLLAGAFLLSCGAALAQETTIKIAVVDLERVVGLSKQGQDLNTKLQKFQETVQAEGDAKTKAAADLRQRIVDGGQSLSEEKLAEMQKELEDKAIEIRRFRDDKQREGQKMQTEGLKEIERSLEPIFKAIQEEKGYDLILNNVPGVVVMANENVDITPLVVERMNAGSGG